MRSKPSFNLVLCAGLFQHLLRDSLENLRVNTPITETFSFLWALT